MVSAIIHIAVFVVSTVFNFFAFIINAVAELLGYGAVIATKKYGNAKLKKRQGSAKEKISTVLDSIYCLNNNSDVIEKCEQNVVVLDKKIMPLSENTRAVSELDGDEDALEMAQEVLVKYILVELPSKERINFAIHDSNIYETIFVGDVGTLTYKGEQWISFKRNIQSQNKNLQSGI